MYDGNVNEHGTASARTFLLKQSKIRIYDEDNIIIVEIILKSELSYTKIFEAKSRFS